MSKARLTSAMRVAALRRLAETAGAFATILRRGDDGAGILLVQLQSHNGDRQIWEQLPDMQKGGLSWQRSGPAERPGVTPAPDALAAWIDRRIGRDSDLWLVELDGPDLEGLRQMLQNAEL